MMKTRSDMQASIDSLRKQLDKAWADCRALEAERDGLRSAALNALHWFRKLGYNSHGVVMSDDLPDHEPVMKDLIVATKEGE